MDNFSSWHEPRHVLDYFFLFESHGGWNHLTNASLVIVSRAPGFTKEVVNPGEREVLMIKTPKRYEGPGLWAWLESFFIPKRYPILSQHLISCHIVFGGIL